MQGEVEHVLSFEKGLTSLMKQALLALPSAAPRWNVVLDAMQVAEDTSLQSQLANSLMTTLHTIKLQDDEAALRRDLFDPLQSIVAQVQKSYELPAPQLENQRKDIFVAARACFDSCRDDDSYATWHAVGVDLLGMVEKREDTRTLFRIADAVENSMAVQAAITKYKALGTTLDERIASGDLEASLRSGRASRRR